MTSRLRKALAISLFAVSAAAGAQAEGLRLRAARIAADDVLATASFYVSALGMTQTRVLNRDGAPFEVFLNYGATLEEASESRFPKLLVLRRKPGDPEPSVSNLVFGVPDVEGAVSRSLQSGGTLSRPVTVSKTTGSKIAFIRDPAGNEIELIEE